MIEIVRPVPVVGVSRKGEGQAYVSAGRSLRRPLRTSEWIDKIGMELTVLDYT
jgi:hypothetical protein